MDALFHPSSDRLLCCNEPPYNGQNYFVRNGEKHWIASIEFYSNGLFDASLVETVNAEETASLPLSYPLCYPPGRLEDTNNFSEARAYLLQHYRGKGVEFGAAAQPMPFPLGCHLTYADPFKVGEGCTTGYEGEFVPVHYQTDLNHMQGLPDEAYDFLASAHSIEHTYDPIGVLSLAYRKLKPGGRFFLVVPHKEYTLDKPRATTSLRHLVEDYRQYNYERYVFDLMDFSEYAIFSDELYETAHNWHNSRQKYEAFLDGHGPDIHYHTFTEESFAQLIDWYNANEKPWSDYTIWPVLDGKTDLLFEFWVELVK
ncbi:class I SAM-dependent methyltransferase [Ruminococcaceae bacterium OttesenSCG-928-I18]|nr:class I SAM-dependent methyltransferase [Ruminococcaceae bacterium OttesenSCG-928-I18]